MCVWIMLFMYAGEGVIELLFCSLFTLKVVLLNSTGTWHLACSNTVIYSIVMQVQLFVVVVACDVWNFLGGSEQTNGASVR